MKIKTLKNLYDSLDNFLKKHQCEEVPVIIQTHDDTGIRKLKIDDIVLESVTFSPTNNCIIYCSQL